MAIKLYIFVETQTKSMLSNEKKRLCRLSVNVYDSLLEVVN